MLHYKISKVDYFHFTDTEQWECNAFSDAGLSQRIFIIFALANPLSQKTENQAKETKGAVNLPIDTPSKCVLKSQIFGPEVVIQFYAFGRQKKKKEFQ